MPFWDQILVISSHWEMRHWVYKCLEWSIILNIKKYLAFLGRSISLQGHSMGILWCYKYNLYWKEKGWYFHFWKSYVTVILIKLTLFLKSNLQKNLQANVICLIQEGNNLVWVSSCIKYFFVIVCISERPLGSWFSFNKRLTD